MSLDNPAAVMGRIDEILTDLAGRENDFEAAVKRLARLEAEWEYKLQLVIQTASAPSADKRKAEALTSCVAANADKYKELVDTAAEVKATRAVVGLLEAQLSALQSVLRAQTREAFISGGVK